MISMRSTVSISEGAGNARARRALPDIRSNLPPSVLVSVVTRTRAHYGRTLTVFGRQIDPAQIRGRFK